MYRNVQDFLILTYSLTNAGLQADGDKHDEKSKYYFPPHAASPAEPISSSGVSPLSLSFMKKEKKNHHDTPSAKEMPHRFPLPAAQPQGDHRERIAGSQEADLQRGEQPQGSAPQLPIYANIGVSCIIKVNNGLRR